MFCIKCGEAIPDGSIICPKCGANLNEASDRTVVYASQNDASQININEEKTTKLSKKAWIGIAAVATIAIVIFAIISIGKANLKNSIEKEWYDVEDSIIKVLEIDGNEIEYRLETGYSFLDTTLGTYEWKAVSSNKIKIKRYGDEYETFTIELNDDKNVMTVSPAITSVDSSETWYHIDY